MGSLSGFVPEGPKALLVVELKAPPEPNTLPPLVLLPAPIVLLPAAAKGGPNLNEKVISL